jgi:hypothetical protein
METTAVHKTLLKTLGISAATAALAFFAYGASAQDKKPMAPKKPPACTTIKDDAACKARDDCTWADPTGKAKKGSCKAKPKTPPKAK